MRHFLTRGSAFAGLMLAVLASGLTTKHCSAAILDFTNFADFQTAADGALQILDFETLTTGLDISNIPGVTISEFDGLDLAATSTAIGETLSGTRFLGTPDLPDGQFSEIEELTIEFDEPRSAIGLWVQYDPTDPVNTDLLVLEDLANPNNFAEVDETDFVQVGNSRAFFIGLVDDQGLDSLTGITIATAAIDPFDEIRYTIDNVVSYQVAAVPEPGSIAFCVVACGGVALRRKRKRAAIA